MSILPVRPTIFLPFLLCTLASLNAQQREEPLFRWLSPDQSGIRFSNYLIESDTFYMSLFIYAYNGGGVSIGDINGDDLPDIYFTGTQSHSPSRLYLNRGKLRFEDISLKAGLLDSSGIRFGTSMIDIDGDGDLDIYVCRQNGPNRLYINNGNLTFTDRAAAFGLDYCCSSTQASFFDYDRDGDLDLYLGINGKAFEREPMVKGLPDRFFRNDNGHFIDVTEQTGIHDAGYALSVSVGDVNEDGWPDVYVTNDFQERDLLYINNHDGTFTERMRELMRHTSTSAMGSDIADFNNDGLLDIVAVDMAPEPHWRKMSNATNISTYSPVFDSSQMMRNTLQYNRGGGIFSDIAPLAGISETDWSWSPLLADYDNDGDKDLFISNGFKRDVQNLDVMNYIDPHTSGLPMLKKIPELRVPNYLYRNNGDMTFTNVAAAWGADQIVNSNGAAWADLDRDGDLDLVVNNLDSVAFILENRAADQKLGTWIDVSLRGTGANTRGIGARVLLYRKGSVQSQDMMPVRGYLSSVDYLLHFGLGQDDRIDSIRVIWPDQTTELRTRPKGRRITLDQKQATEIYRKPEMSPPLFTSVTDPSLSRFRQREDEYYDFYNDRLIPRRYSQNGPSLAVGDIDGNGRDDLWIGGSTGFAGTIFLQGNDARFREVEQPALLADASFEDQGGLLIDVDNDGDLDLFVVSGGNEVMDDDPLLQDRLYLNDGNGTFESTSDRLPPMRTSSSAVAAADFDGDGDLDLLVGGRISSGSYPDIPRTYLLRNENGSFADVTAELAPDLQYPGMLSTILWSDYDGDGDPDIIAAGEWTTPLLFENRSGHFLNRTEGSGFEGSEGWWNSLVGSDFDHDGDIDYVFGNTGLNTRPELHPSAAAPVQLYAADFDENGSRDLVMSYFFDGVEYPTRNKSDAASQMGTYIKRKFPTTTSYASTDLHHIYSPQKLDSARHLKATTFASVYAENRGNGRFILHPLPIEAQIAPIHGMIAADVDGDGNEDILLIDNFFGPDGTVVQYDAGIGLILKGMGDGTFQAIKHHESGFRMGCDSRSLAIVANGPNEFILVGMCNQSSPTIFRWNNQQQGRVIHLDPGDRISSVVIEFENGRTERSEVYSGSGYLSQSSQILLLPAGRPVRQITLYRGSTVVRQITPPAEVQ